MVPSLLEPMMQATELTSSDADGSATPGLVIRASTGDPEAFRLLVHRFQETIFRWALGTTGDRDDADDVTQQVLLKIHQHIGALRERGHLRTWLFRVTHNTALELHRTRGRRTAALDRELLLTPGERVALAPVDHVDLDRTLSLVDFYFHELPDRQRLIFDLVDLQGHTPVEIAEMLDMEPVTVRANLCKARRTIRTRMLRDHPELAETLE
jgi:RNA polymerase sigma-70 factor (ECF subfamily)